MRGSVDGRRRQAEAARRTHTKHGMRRTPEYYTWRSMKQRCLCVNDPFYHRYGGRGIKIHPAWIDSFEEFFAYVGKRPEGKTLDRIDGDGDYVPGNVQWSDAKTQQRNRVTNHSLSHGGETLTIVGWAEKLNMYPETISSRLHRGWSVERTLSTPLLRVRTRTKTRVE